MRFLLSIEKWIASLFIAPSILFMWLKEIGRFRLFFSVLAVDLIHVSTCLQT